MYYEFNSFVKCDLIVKLCRKIISIILLFYLQVWPEHTSAI